MLKEAPYAQAHEALETILSRVAKMIAKLTQERECQDLKTLCIATPDNDECKIQKQLGEKCFKEKPAAVALGNLRSVFNEMLNIADTVEQKLSLPSRSMQRLLAVNFIEALLEQRSSSAVVNALSAADIKTSFDQEIAFIINKLGKKIEPSLLENRELMIISQKGARAAPTQESEGAWIDLVNQWGKALKPDELANIIAMVNTIDDLGALPTWIYARVFPAMRNQSWGQWIYYLFARNQSEAAQLSSTLLKEFNDSKDIIGRLQNIKQQLTTVDYNRWADPKRV